MNDLELTRLCAMAAGERPYTENGVEQIWSTGTILIASDAAEHGWLVYAPLHNRGQALELVERLGMRLHMETQCNGTMWNAFAPTGGGALSGGSSPSILRAICLCAARAQQSRESQK